MPPAMAELETQARCAARPTTVPVRAGTRGGVRLAAGSRCNDNARNAWSANYSGMPKCRLDTPGVALRGARRLTVSRGADKKN